MSRLPSVAELAPCLHEAGPESVLERPFPKLIASIGDLDTRELFEHLASDQRGFDLRSVLRFGELDPWVARTCTEREAGLIRDQLQACLLLEPGSHDAPVPSEPRALERWATERGVPDLLRLRR